MIARTRPGGEDVEQAGMTAEPGLAQRLAEELVVDMVRRHIDVVGLLELELDVIESLGGEPVDAKGHPTPLAMLAAVLIDQAFQRIEAEWRDSRTAATAEGCVCCAMEQTARRNQAGRKARGDAS